MIEEMKQITELIAKLPGTAMWILLGFAIYKLATYLAATGSVVVILRLLINKIHDVMTQPKVIEHKVYDLSFSVNSYSEFMGLIRNMKGCSQQKKMIWSTITSADVSFLEAALQEKKDREKKS